MIELTFRQLLGNCIASHGSCRAYVHVARFQTYVAIRQKENTGAKDKKGGFGRICRCNETDTFE